MTFVTSSENIPKTYSLGLQPDCAEGYGQFWGMRSGSGLVLGSDDRLAVAEADTSNDLGEAVGAIQSAPVALG
jgi:hypothetical protein